MGEETCDEPLRTSAWEATDSAVTLDYANYFQFAGDCDYLFSFFFIAMIANIMPIVVGNRRLSSNNLKIIPSLIAQGIFLSILV